MKYSLTCLTALLLAPLAALHADDAAKLAAILAPATAHGGTVTIPPGDYELDGTTPLPIASHTTVSAYGARFHLPKALGDKARVVLFAGENVSSFRWFGGHFTGHVFDPAKGANSWEPNANTRAILITTTPGGRTENVTFRDITSDGLAGAVISVMGAGKKGSEREMDTFARNVTVENCTLERSGKFMWDYGYLWQIIYVHYDRECTGAAESLFARFREEDVHAGKLISQDAALKNLVKSKLGMNHGSAGKDTSAAVPVVSPLEAKVAKVREDLPLMLVLPRVREFIDALKAGRVPEADRELRTHIESHKERI